MRSKPTRKPKILFSRCINLTQGQKNVSLILKISYPTRSIKDRAWLCSWSIPQVDTTALPVRGEDAVAAFVNCLVTLRTFIENSKLDLWWLEKGDCCGLNYLFQASKDNKVTCREGVLEK